MIQFLADQIDQMDLALDQLAINDRNFDRFAMMLIDNVVELTLHQHAKERNRENDMWRSVKTPPHDPKAVAVALGRGFDAKVKLAKLTRLVPPQMGESITYLHEYRNQVYHAGVRHEGILHSLAVFYLVNACDVLSNFSPFGWIGSSNDRISHRAVKYLGESAVFRAPEAFQAAWKRLRAVGQSMGNTLVRDLHSDMEKSIREIDEAIQFVADDGPQEYSREEVVINAQAWPFVFSEEGLEIAAKNGLTGPSPLANIDWMIKNHPWPFKGDPIPSWTNRLKSLEGENDDHVALKKYCDFMVQTEDFRSKIFELAAGLDAHIQHQIDVARGK